MERFIAYLSSITPARFPLACPVQVMVLPITDRVQEYAKAGGQPEKRGFSAETDFRNEKIGYKIREAQLQKIPYMLVVGDKEVENGTVSVRTRSGGDEGAMSLSDFAEKLKKEIEEKR